MSATPTRPASPPKGYLSGAPPRWPLAACAVVAITAGGAFGQNDGGRADRTAALEGDVDQLQRDQQLVIDALDQVTSRLDALLRLAQPTPEETARPAPQPVTPAVTKPAATIAGLPWWGWGLIGWNLLLSIGWLARGRRGTAATAGDDTERGDPERGLEHAELAAFHEGPLASLAATAAPAAIAAAAPIAAAATAEPAEEEPAVETTAAEAAPDTPATTATPEPEAVAALFTDDLSDLDLDDELFLLADEEAPVDFDPQRN